MIDSYPTSSTLFHGVIFTNSFGGEIDQAIKNRIERVVFKTVDGIEGANPQSLKYSLLNMLGGVLEIQAQEVGSDILRLGVVGIYDLNYARDIRRNAELLRPKYLRIREDQEKMLAILVDLYPYLEAFPIYGVVPYEDGLDEGVFRVLTKHVLPVKSTVSSLN